MWDVVQRAWAFQDSAAADISARLTDSADASAGVDDTNMTPQLIQLLDTPAPLEVQSTVAAAPPAGRASAPARNAGRRRQTKRAAAGEGGRQTKLPKSLGKGFPKHGSPIVFFWLFPLS